MHKFKSQTGYTLHKYIQQKRLAFSKSLIIKGHKITEIYLKCGFGDYSSFIRAFKKPMVYPLRITIKTLRIINENSYF